MRSIWVDVAGLLVSGCAGVLIVLALVWLCYLVDQVTR